MDSEKYIRLKFPYLEIIVTSGHKIFILNNGHTVNLFYNTMDVGGCMVLQR